jgi:glutamate dehydrogenase/leucine dehydrogenase
MSEAFNTLLSVYVKPYKISFRTAAYIRAIKRIIQAEKDRGRI